MPFRVIALLLAWKHRRGERKAKRSCINFRHYLTLSQATFNIIELSRVRMFSTDERVQ
jgi:hypothetical protein